jgi:uncharacterized protein (DUF1330 family)
MMRETKKNASNQYTNYRGWVDTQTQKFGKTTLTFTMQQLKHENAGEIIIIFLSTNKFPVLMMDKEYTRKRIFLV